MIDERNQRTRGFGLVHAPELDRYLNRLFDQVKAAAGTPNWPGRVHILANASLDAYATAAGNIYISLPWIRSVDSEDELVALIAHEFGHIYLHFHQLEGAIAKTDGATRAIAIGMQLAKRGMQASGWSQIDTLLFAYTASRQLGTGFYSRSQELAADQFALAVTTRLNRSFESGLKSMLERLLSWEEINEARLKAQENELRENIARAVALKTEREASTLRSDVAKSMVRASGALENAGNQLQNSMELGIRSFFAGLVHTHPSTEERLDVLVRLAEANMQELPETAANTDPLKKLLQLPTIGALLRNYELAFEVMSDPKAPKALAAARQANSGPTRTHALPLYAAYVARQVNETSTGSTSDMLTSNLKSDKDRAWFLYQERAHRLALQGERKQAGAVINQGLTDFKGALAPELYTIRFAGEFVSWNAAKERAHLCARRFPEAAIQCREAAISPQERSQQDAQTKERAEALNRKLFKKLR